MKVLCNVCEASEATVFCCADEAALCWACDERVHGVNKLANKHQRVSLSTFPSRIPKCDVCQEALGYFFCLEDRALLCRNCDFSIHTANNFVASHQRFLLTGVELGLEVAEPCSSSSPPGKILEPDIGPVSEKQSASVPTNSEYSKQLPKKVSEIEDLVSSRTPFSGGAGAGSIRQWQFDEFLGLDDDNHYLSYMDNDSSKANVWKVGDSDSSTIFRSGELDGDDYFSQMPDASWAVPEIPSSDIASGLYWPKVHHDPTESTVYVPDISGSPLLNLYDDQYQPQGPNLKNRRLF